jgi:heat shock 70kDa protein 1/2/6/8
VLVGGSSNFPMIEKLLTDFFDGKKPLKTTKPIHDIVVGASVRAAILSR